MDPCPRCDSKMKIKVSKRDVGKLVGLPSVIVTNLPALVCPKCGEFMIQGSLLQKIMLKLALKMIEDVDHLGGCEVRYLRKFLRETQDAFAERLGISRPTLARWEGHPLAEVEPMTSYAIRSVVAAALFDQGRIKRPIRLAPTTNRPGHQRPEHYQLKLGKAA